MLIHPWDAAQDDVEWRSFISGRAFGQLIAPGQGRALPVVTPAPYLLDGDVLRFHLARPNPVWKAIEENPTAVFVVTGDDAYIPAAWKAIDDEDPTRGIPTWYYASIQLIGQVTVFDDAASKLALLRRQLAAYEPGSGAADPAVHERKLPGIRAAQLVISDIEAKFKYGGNVDEAHRRAVAADLARRASPGDLEARDHLLRRLD